MNLNILFFIKYVFKKIAYLWRKKLNGFLFSLRLDSMLLGEGTLLHCEEWSGRRDAAALGERTLQWENRKTMNLAYNIYSLFGNTKTINLAYNGVQILTKFQMYPPIFYFLFFIMARYPPNTEWEQLNTIMTNTEFIPGKISTNTEWEQLNFIWI